ncbi:class I SAM-dependent methyltransferase [Spirosoma sp.]|uniref:class I SAM-dependent methyltransferase n=1 Tax=Spirosoma sp. TaxID=1899569 RepID=UPI00262CAB3A|nr:class I SAM-dependent methyltransferase [Spirosoma sp.]MCX6214057.1 methyltransferase domain-containing protein [Spirosoma sp.]
MFRKSVPPVLYKTLKPTLKYLQKKYYSILDFKDDILNLRDPLVPPRAKIFIGGGDFKQTGLEFLKLFVDLAKLKPEEQVLDIGCGIGRMAAPLTGYLKNGGSYEGFDIVEDGILWCQANITSRFPNFRFQLADIHNDHYNPKGHYEASKYIFPFKDGHFDFAFLTSVFTHMPKPEVDHYVAEIGRVLKPGGRCLVTFFLLNEESRELMKSPESAHNIQYLSEGRYIAYPDDPEVCVGFDESYVIDLFKRNGMSATIYPGSWCSRNSFTSFQDIVLAYKN